MTGFGIGGVDLLDSAATKVVSSLYRAYTFRKTTIISLTQRFLACGPRTPGGPRLFRKLNNFSRRLMKYFYVKKAKSEIENFKTLCKSEGM
jgi:hypothetical protein